MAAFNSINILTKATDQIGLDTSQPYNFQQWRVRNTNVPPQDAFIQYDAYLRAWYIKRDTTNVVAVNYVKEAYKNFLKTLGVTPRNQQEKELFENVDFDNDISVQSAIAGFARKLKDVTVYLANRRNDILYSKLKDNITGTSVSLERLFYSYILTAFTRKTTPDGAITNSFVITNPDILTSLPFLSVIANNFSIQLEEIYDTNNYFDRDPSVPVTDYLANPNTVSTMDTILLSAGEYSVPDDYLLATAAGAVVVASASMATAPTYFTFIGDGTTTSFSINNITSSTASDYQVSVEGIVQTPDSSYTVSSINQTIVFSEPPPANSIIVIVIRY
jgi:hypothetical protein